jgi:hypothetical protein
MFTVGWDVTLNTLSINTVIGQLHLFKCKVRHGVLQALQTPKTLIGAKSLRLPVTLHILGKVLKRSS